MRRSTVVPLVASHREPPAPPWSLSRSRQLVTHQLWAHERFTLKFTTHVNAYCTAYHIRIDISTHRLLCSSLSMVRVRVWTKFVDGRAIGKVCATRESMGSALPPPPRGPYQRLGLSFRGWQMKWRRMRANNIDFRPFRSPTAAALMEFPICFFLCSSAMCVRVVPQVD